jgi:hypothetical protein
MRRLTRQKSIADRCPPVSAARFAAIEPLIDSRANLFGRFQHPLMGRIIVEFPGPLRAGHHIEVI